MAYENQILSAEIVVETNSNSSNPVGSQTKTHFLTYTLRMAETSSSFTKVVGTTTLSKVKAVV